MKYVAGHRITGQDKTYFGLHSHEHLELIYFFQGDCNFQIDNTIIHLEPGDLLLIDQLTIHKAFVNFDQPYVRSVLHFQIEWIEPTLNLLGEEDLLELFKIENGIVYRFKNQSIAKDIDYFFSKLGGEEEMTDIQAQLFTIQLLLTIKQGTKVHLGETKSETKDKTARVEEVVNYIAAHYQDKLTIAKIAKGVKLSESYLSHLFKDFTGMSVMNFLMSYRLTQAKYLLALYPDLSVKEVSEQCGFESNAHFSRFFKKHTGLSPLHYRKEHTT